MGRRGRKRGRIRSDEPAQRDVSPLETEPYEETWLDLEKLATRIYRELKPGCVVEHNVHLPGCIGKGKRQVDVAIRDPDAGTLAVVDCKDWSKKVDVADVGQFATLVEDVEATSGILICNRGYTSTAVSAAKHYGIALCKLHDVASRKWQLDVRVPVVLTEWSASDTEIALQSWSPDGREPDPGFPMVVNKDGETVEAFEVFEDMWNVGDLPRTPGLHAAYLDLRVRTSLIGQIEPHSKVRVRYRVVESSKLGYVEPHNARGILDTGSGELRLSSLDVQTTVLETLSSSAGLQWRPIDQPEDLAIKVLCRIYAHVIRDMGTSILTARGMVSSDGPVL